ncbi:MAG TPA: CHRD domain-containing protein [Acidimicrobiales bacterium]|nr:CHRD domain-containing protein [Acidimicrobiales bacterium]
MSFVIWSLVNLAWAGPASADRDSRGGNKGAVFATHLTGEEEVPDPGDADGIGNAQLRIGPGDVVCYRLRVRKMDAPTAAHIHVAPRGEAGPVVVPLTGRWAATPDGGFRLEGCVSDGDAAAILSNPVNHYVNVHNKAFPPGAVRGQLH